MTVKQNAREKYLFIRKCVSNLLPTAIDDTSQAYAQEILDFLAGEGVLTPEIHRGFLMEIYVENLLACTGLSDEKVAREVLDYFDDMITFPGDK